MTKLILDIETIPAPDEMRETVIQILKTKKAKKKDEVIPSDEDLFRSTSLEGTFGQILCIGYIKEGYGKSFEKKVLSGTEKEILEQFWKIAVGVDLFIGHNIMDFDLPYIYKRSVVVGVKPTREISFARYRSTPIFDTQKEWDKWAFGNAQKLDTLAKAFGFPTSKVDMDGSQVYDNYLNGKSGQIYDYCMRDVELTRKVYYKMTFQPIQEPLLEEDKDDELPF